MYEIALISQTLRCMSSEILRNGLVKHPSLAGLPLRRGHRASTCPISFVPDAQGLGIEYPIPRHFC